jgi:hypothetical protein
MNMMQNAAAGTIRASLRYPAFRPQLAARAGSQIGDWIHNLALVPPVCRWTHWAGAATVARAAPIVVLGPLGGAIADRFDQRLIMIVRRALPRQAVSGDHDRGHAVPAG